MLASLTQNASSISPSTKATHILVVLPQFAPSDKLQNKPDFLGRNVLETLLLRRKMQLGEIAGTPVAANLESGSLCVWMALDLSKSVFEQQTSILKAVQLLLE
jgi:leucyl aminopeptidase